MKKLLFICLMSVVCLSCGDNQTLDDSDQFSVILITNMGGLGDKGFNDAGWAGCQLAQERLAADGHEIDIQFLESSEQSDYVDNLIFAAERADVIVGLGFLIADALNQVAAQYPQRNFVFVDGALEGDNIASVVFRSEEGGYLAGLLASQVSESGVVGIIPGMDIPPVEAYAAGFRSGYKSGRLLNEDEFDILSTTVGSFNDPVKGKSVALSLINQNADILFQLAGNSGLGVIEAVKESNDRVFAIGADIDQDDLAPGKILVSILKRIDLVVADQIVAAYQETFEAGLLNVGLAEGYISLSSMRHSQNQVTDNTQALLNQAKEAIIQGDLTVPATYSDEAAYDYSINVFN